MKQIVIPIENGIIVQVQYHPETPSTADDNVLISSEPGEPNAASVYAGVILNMQPTTAKKLAKAILQGLDWQAERYES